MESLIHCLRHSQALAKIVGQAPAFLDAIKDLPAIARSDAAVLIAGESGTGKELVARAIHYLSNRASLPFVAVNCGSLTESLLESELFGHERGSFTNAHVRRGGLIAQAQKGTLFLDEVDTLAFKGQVNLLRFLQDKRYRLVGSSSEQEADVRIVAATNASIQRLLNSGTFRTDLYYRLCIFSISLPPLRDRKEDVLLLADHFLKKHSPESMPQPKLGRSACEGLVSGLWPGNVRELENAIIRGIHLKRTDCIEVDDLGLAVSGASAPDGPKSLTFSVAKRRVIDEFERSYLTHLMSVHGGNVTGAARATGKERRDLGKLLKKHRLDPGSFHTFRT